MLRTLGRISASLLIPAILGAFTLGLPVAPALLGAQGQENETATAQADATPSPTATPAATDQTPEPTAEPSPTPTATPHPVEIEPDGITIYGQWGPGLGIQGLSTRAAPTYYPAQLSLFADPTQISQVDLFHPPINSPREVAQIGVTEKDECDTVSGPADQTKEARCFSVQPVGKLSPGEYSSKLIVAVPGQTPQSVDLSLKVQVNPWWMFIIVALGVVSAEFLTQWNRRLKYSIRWKARRLEWLDLLSEGLDWIKKGYNNSEITPDENAVLQLVKDGIGVQVKALQDWVKEGRDGKVTLESVPVDEPQVRGKIYPLKDSVQRYTAGTEFSLASLENGFKSLSDEVKTEARANLKNALAEADSLYQEFAKLFPDQGDGAYQKLKGFYLEGKLTDAVLKAAWDKLESLKKSGLGLKEVFEASIKNQSVGEFEISALAGVWKTLNDNLASFQTDVLDIAREQLSKVEAIAATPAPVGKQESKSLLVGLTALAEIKNRAGLKAQMANEPMRFYQSGQSGVGKAVGEIEAALKDIQIKTDDIKKNEVTDRTLVNLMLKDIHDHLQTADEKFAKEQDEAAMESTWQELSKLYARDRRFFRLGERLIKLSKIDRIKKEYLARAYRYMLEGKLLDGEIELERAEADRIPRGKLSLTMFAKKTTKYLSKKRSVWSISSVALIVVAIVALVFGSFITTLSGIQLFSLDGTDSIARMPVWWLILPMAALVLGLYLLYRVIKLINWSNLALFLGELTENWLANLVRATATVFAQMLVIVVATALVSVTYNLADKANTWGSPFDFVSAFVWGAVANRLAAPAKSGWETLIKGLSPSTETETTEKKEEEAST